MDLPWGTLTEIRDLWEPRGFRQRALSFVGCGLIAGASGLALIALDSDSDARRALEVALVQTPSAFVECAFRTQASERDAASCSAKAQAPCHAPRRDRVVS